ncbi:MAG: hypothetical protein B0D91_12795, partial [Oceanospirillales bacterium LUC14_002_19_P2]
PILENRKKCSRLTRISVQDLPEWVFKSYQNRCSSCARIRSFKALANTAEVIAEMPSVTVQLEGYDILFQTEKMRTASWLNK